MKISLIHEEGDLLNCFSAHWNSFYAGLSAPYTLENILKLPFSQIFHQIPHNSKPYMCNLAKRFSRYFTCCTYNSLFTEIHFHYVSMIFLN